ncbi:MAG TPA: barstar family protein [Burkholderiales bacterium]|nr:barstar family protein [Burkholderiales bacterium]
MGKLLERLRDPSRSGVYRASRTDVIADAVRGSALDVAEISLAKEHLFKAFASALEFPAWFGQNWDALEDCLGDLSWRAAEGHVLLVLHHDRLPKDDLGVLLDVLASSAEYWAARGKPFFAVFIDPRRSLELPDLYREK